MTTSNPTDTQLARLTPEAFAGYARRHFETTGHWPAPVTMPQLRYLLHFERAAYRHYEKMSHIMPDGTVIGFQSFGERLEEDLSGIPAEPLTPSVKLTDREQETFLRTLQEDHQFRKAILVLLTC